MKNEEVFEIRKLIAQVNGLRRKMEDDYAINALTAVLNHLQDLESKVLERKK